MLSMQWDEHFCPFDAIGLPVHLVKRQPHAQKDFARAVRSARYVIGTTSLLSASLHYGQEDIDQAVKYFTQADRGESGELNHEAWREAFDA